MRKPKHLRKGMVVFIDGCDTPFLYRGRYHPEFYGTVTITENGGRRSRSVIRYRRGNKGSRT